MLSLRTSKKHRKQLNHTLAVLEKNEHNHEKRAEEEIDLSKDYFDNGLFRTASGAVLVKKSLERKLWDFEKIMEEADVVDAEDDKKLKYLLANFRDRKDITFAFAHGAGTLVDYRDWKGRAGFTDEDMLNLRALLLHGKKAAESKVLHDCTIL